MNIMIISALREEVRGLNESVVFTGVGKINATKKLERQFGKSSFKKIKMNSKI